MDWIKIALLLIVLIPVLYLAWQSLPPEMGGPYGLKTIVAVLLGICILLLLGLPFAWVKEKAAEAGRRASP